ncbi:MAG: polysaccharide lyase [Candidatus Paceibacterota bacterium]
MKLHIYDIILFMNISFSHLPIGPYTKETWRTQWPGVTKPRGVAEGRLSIVGLDGENVLCVTCLKDQIGPDQGGTSWSSRFGKSYEEATVQYKVKIDENFNFKRGGKLPGLCGGTSPMGGASTAEADGFSARVMWRELGLLEQYVYYMDKESDKKWGQDFIWTKAEDKQVPITSEMWKTLDKHFEDRIYLTPGSWHTIKTYIKMNTPGQEDGKLISWFDDQEIANLNLSFRKDNSFAIDSFKFAVFFGGNDSSWAPEKDERIYFKDFNFTFGTV